MSSPSLSGRRLGAYEVGPLIGAGGMGEVYRARDSKLNRDVAIKTLLPAVASDAERLARFRREAQVLASLNHPNIAHIHGIEEGETGPFLVMELVEGPTLADRIAQGPIPIDESISIAKQIADALEAAHERGVIHRDLKPANIKVSDDGAVKVLDFGLAKALDPGAGIGEPGTDANSPTITSPAMTIQGLILGTAAYMSPEQAKGRAVDKRTDIWAFGCVLYEMLTGKRAFDGEDVTDTIAAVVRGEPDWTALPKDTPPRIRLLLQRSLDKARGKRIGDIGVARFLLEDHSEVDVSGAPNRDRAHAPQLRVRLAAASLVLVAVVVGLIFAAQSALRRAIPLERPVQFAFVPPESQSLAVQGNDHDLALSRDGTQLVYRSFDAASSNARLVVRSMQEIGTRPLPGTLAARNPFFSPDGRWVGFAAQGELRKVETSGGTPVVVCKIDGVLRGGVWADNGTIVFATANGGGLMRVSASGGQPVRLADTDRSAGHTPVFPQVLPGGDIVLYTSFAGNFDTASIHVLDTRSGVDKQLIAGGIDAVYLDDGFIIYATVAGGRRVGSLRAVRFDSARLEVVGESVEMVSDISVLPSTAANYAVSARGDLVFVPASEVAAQVAARSLVWVDAHGTEMAVGTPTRPYATARLSPDATKVVLDVRDDSNDVWIWDFRRQTLSALDRDPAQDLSSIWSADGKRIIWASTRGGSNPSLFWKPFDGTGQAARLTSSTTAQFPTAVTRDGTTLFFFSGTGAYENIFRLSLTERAPKPEPVISSAANEFGGEVSPDQHWLAYHSSESGQYQVYVRPFPDAARARIQISTTGGTRPAWSRDGRQLFYLDQNAMLTSVSITVGGSTLAAGTPRRLLDRAYHVGTTILGFDLRSYDVAPDGRFLMIKDAQGVPEQTRRSAGVVVMLNWIRQVRERFPAP